MYPPNHPSLGPVVENVVVHLASLFEGREKLSIGVANRQLVIEGVSTDKKHPVLSDLARRLHDQQLGAVSFKFGVRAQDVEGLLRTLAASADEDGIPLGMLGEAMPTWAHIQLHALGYEGLELRESTTAETGVGEVGQLWIGLAQAALSGRGGSEVDAEGRLTNPEAYNPRVLAAEIGAEGKDEAYDQVITGYLRQLTGQLKGAKGGEAERVRGQVGELIEEMDEATLQRLVKMGGDMNARQEFVLETNQSLAVDAVVKVVKAAANASGQNISTSMTRLLSKLSAHSESGPHRVRSQANSALRENVEELMEDWKLKDPNPEHYTRVLDTMAHAAPVFEMRNLGGANPGAALGDGPIEREEELPGPLRVVYMALEVDAWGETVKTAVYDLVQLGLTGKMLVAIEEAPPGNALATRIRDYLTEPEQIVRFLSGDVVDAFALSRLVREMGETAIDPLLDVMAVSESRAVRRAVFDTLVELGSAVGDEAARRLAEDDRWFVQRNLIALLARLPEIPANVKVMSFLSNPEPRVRREALPLAFRVPAARDRALGLGLVDEDERVCRMALHEVRETVPKALLPTLINRVVKAEKRSEDLRVMAIRSLGGVTSSLARDGLLEITTAGKSMLGKVKLAEASLLVIAALKVLASDWGSDSEARGVVDAARKSKDKVLQRAVLTGGS